MFTLLSSTQGEVLECNHQRLGLGLAGITHVYPTLQYQGGRSQSVTTIGLGLAGITHVYPTLQYQGGSLRV